MHLCNFVHGVCVCVLIPSSVWKALCPGCISKQIQAWLPCLHISLRDTAFILMNLFSSFCLPLHSLSAVYTLYIVVAQRPSPLLNVTWGGNSLLILWGGNMIKLSSKWALHLESRRDWLLLSRVRSAFVVLELIIGFTLQMCLFTGNFLNIFI